LPVVADAIQSKLQEAFQPDNLDVVDESAHHAGHAGARPQGETHFKVDISSKDFSGKSRVERQRLVYAVLKEELDGPVHALALATSSPDDA
jgi:BolA protein|tara:strand:- start:128 stop:400 length:273 start_codon:yes stop_codon:yes gene_type:complete